MENLKSPNVKGQQKRAIISPENKSPDLDIGVETTGKKRLTRRIFLKFAFVLFFIILLTGVVLIALTYYRSNFTPESILKRAVSNTIGLKNINYEATIKLTFSYADQQEKLNINNVEIYSLLKRSLSDSHEIVIRGDHNWGDGTSVGKFNIDWSIAGKNAFGFDGYYQNTLLSYRVNPSTYSDLIDEGKKDKYSQIDLSDLFSRIISPDLSNLVSGVKADDLILNVSEVFRSDLIDGNSAYHYKVKLSGKVAIKEIVKRINLNDLDVWIDKKSVRIKKIKGSAGIENIGMEGNDMDVQFELKL